VDSQAVVGRLHGLPVVTDPSIPTTGGAANNEDPIIVARFDDLILWEGGVRGRVLPQTKAMTLTVLIQLYGYLAFTAARFPASVVEVTGLTAPDWT